MDVISIVVGAVIAALVIWTVTVMMRHYAAIDRPIRLPRMFARLGLSVQDAADTGFADHLPTAARQCLICRSAEECDHLLASETALDEPPDFCPNASFIRGVRRERQHR